MTLEDSVDGVDGVIITESHDKRFIPNDNTKRYKITYIIPVLAKSTLGLGLYEPSALFDLNGKLETIRVNNKYHLYRIITHDENIPNYNLTLKLVDYISLSGLDNATSNSSNIENEDDDSWWQG